MINRKYDINIKIMRDRQDVKDILSGKDKRLLLVIGPCSAWPKKAVIDYVKQIKKIDKKVNSYLKIIIRVYTQKPRTIDGWNGLTIQPDPFKSPNLAKGIKCAVELMQKVLNMSMPIADEALFLSPANILKNYLTWMAIGARSCEDQEHRSFASGIDMPVGIKNPTSGSIETAINSILAVQSEQFSSYYSSKKKTKGNPFAHLVLRGGQKGPNCTIGNLLLAIKLLKEKNIKNPAIIIDASHDNSIFHHRKNHDRQIANIQQVMRLMKNDKSLSRFIKGFMIESFIKDGRQDIKTIHPREIDMEGLSITDACLSLEKSKKIIFEIAQACKSI